jgi:flagellar motor switch protein FliN/FliY
MNATATLPGPVLTYARALLDGCAAALAARLGRPVTAEVEAPAPPDAAPAWLPAVSLVCEARWASGRAARHEVLVPEADALAWLGALGGAEAGPPALREADQRAPLADLAAEMLAAAAVSLAGRGPAPSLVDLRVVEAADDPALAEAVLLPGRLLAEGGPEARAVVGVPAALEALLAAPDAGAPAPAGRTAGLDMLLDIAMPITVELGRTRMLIRDILALGPGSVVELDRLAGEPVDLLVNDRPIAKGEVVVIDESFGIRLTQITHAADRIRSLG